MKYGQIIKPEDVPSLVRSGELRFGMELEFGDTPEFDTIGARTLIFDGIMVNAGLFLCHFKTETTPRLYEFARFPLPELRDGDLIFCQSSRHGAESKHIFSSFHRDGGVLTNAGVSGWVVDIGYFPIWRLPTKKELQEANMAGWYDGRIELEEG